MQVHQVGGAKALCGLHVNNRQSQTTATPTRLGPQQPLGLPSLYFGRVAVQPALQAAPVFFTQKIAAYVQQHAPTAPIMLSIGMPDLAPPETFQQAIQQHATNKSMYTYTPMALSAPLATALQNWFQHRFKIAVDAQQVLPFAGSNEGMFQLINHVIDPQKDGKIWTPTPYYPTFKTAQDLSAWNPLAASLTVDNNYEFDFEAAWQNMSPVMQKKIKAIILNYPNNPTGAIASPEYLQRVLRFAKAHDLLLINDMAYADIYYPGKQPPKSLFEFPEATDAKLIEFHTFSKSFALPGIRMGTAIFSKPLLVPEKQGQKSIYQATLESRAHLHATGLMPLLQQAATEMLRDTDALDQYLEKNRRIYAERATAVTKGLKKMGWPVVSDAETSMPFYLWVAVPDKHLRSEEFAQKVIRKTGVAMIPGSYFGEKGEGYLRIAMTQPLEKLQEALARLKQAGFVYTGENRE